MYLWIFVTVSLSPSLTHTRGYFALQNRFNRRHTTDGLSVFRPTEIAVTVSQNEKQDESVGGMFQTGIILAWDV